MNYIGVMRNNKGAVICRGGQDKTNTLRQVLMWVKLQVPEEKKKGIVYQVSARFVMEYTLASPEGHWRSDWRNTSVQWCEVTSKMVSQCMWPRMNTVLTQRIREWCGQWGVLGKESHQLQSHQNQMLHVHELYQWLLLPAICNPILE